MVGPSADTPAAPSVALLALELPALEELVARCGYSTVHARRLRRTLLLGQRFEDNARLPPRLVERLSTHVCWLSSTSIEVHPAEDGSAKHLVRLQDGGSVEAVHLPGALAGAPSACISSQVGCAMACRFCASGLDKVARNLQAHELLEQVVHLRRRGPVKRLVFMGAGEPTQNLTNVAKALDVLRDEGEIGPRNVLLSTVGPAKAIDRVRALDRRVTLALSLHNPFADERAALIPTQSKETPEALLDAADRFVESTGRPYQVEYVLLGENNESERHARALAALLRGRRAHVSAIRWNPVPGMPFQRPSDAAATAFIGTLRDAGISAQLRRTVGGEKTAACGQLRSARGG